MTTAGTWYPPSAGTGGFMLDAQLFTNPPFHPMPQTTSDALKRRLAGITDPHAILRIIADHIMRNYHRASAREIAALLLITAERGVEP